MFEKILVVAWNDVTADDCYGQEYRLTGLSMIMNKLPKELILTREKMKFGASKKDSCENPKIHLMWLFRTRSTISFPFTCLRFVICVETLIWKVCLLLLIIKIKGRNWLFCLRKFTGLAHLFTWFVEHSCYSMQ